MEQNNYKELIAKYLDGSLPANQHAVFDELVESDPLLANELEFQQEVVDGIKAHRKRELKMRLAAISPLTIGLIGSISTAGLLKAAAGISALSLIGLAVYNQVPDGADDPAKLLNEVEQMEMKQLEPIQPQSTPEPLAEEELEEEMPTISLPEENLTSGIEENQQQLDSHQLQAAAEDQVALSEETEAQPSRQEIVLPEATPVPSPQDSEASLLEEERLLEVSEELQTSAPMGQRAESNPPAISTEKDARYNFHYRFEEDRIYLYGDFSGEPYQLLELNGVEKREFFLYSDGTFYHLLPSRRVLPLKEVLQPGLLKELEHLIEHP